MKINSSKTKRIRNSKLFTKIVIVEILIKKFNLKDTNRNKKIKKRPAGRTLTGNFRLADFSLDLFNNRGQRVTIAGYTIQECFCRTKIQE